MEEIRVTTISKRHGLKVGGGIGNMSFQVPFTSDILSWKLLNLKEGGKSFRGGSRMTITPTSAGSV
jgi:hypothetical protein